MNNNIIGMRINTLLAKRNIKQKELAEALGVKDNIISYFVKGARTPNIEQIIKIADYFNVSTDYLLGRTESTTTDAELRSVCDYTGLSEKAIDGLHYWFKDPETGLVYLPNDFLDLLISSYGNELCLLAQGYKTNLKETVKYKKIVLEKDAAGENIHTTMQKVFEYDDASKLLLFELKETFDSLIDAFAKDEKSENQELDPKIREFNYYFFR